VRALPTQKYSVVVSSNNLLGMDAKNYVDAMRDIDVLLETSGQVAMFAITTPKAGSKMSAAYKAGLRDPYEQSNILLMSAEDHLRTILMTTRNSPLPMFALFTLLRPAAEADARMAFLLDPAIADTQRLARGLTVRYESALEQSRVKLKTGVVDLAPTFARIEQKAKANGIQPVYSAPKQGAPKWIGFGEAMKREIDLFAEYHGGKELIYRVLSSHVHSRPWAWLDSATAQPTDEPGVSQMYVEMNIPFFVSMLQLVLMTHELNLVRLLEHGGYSKTVWIEEKQRQLARLQPEYDKLLSPEPP
jgi:hypothetical protein